MDDDGAASSCEVTSPINYSFYFEMKPFSKLRSAFEALSDGEFCESGIGRIDVDINGFDICVVNSRNSVAQLWLCASDVIGFRCSKPLTRKFVSLRQICHDFLADLNDDDDVVCVSHIVGSDQIFFQFSSRGMVSAEFIETDAQIERCPFFTIFCTIDLPTATLIEMIEHTWPDFVAEDPSTRQSVLAYMKDNFAKFTFRSKNWEIYDVGTKGPTGLRAGQPFQSWFNWTYIAFLKKAASVQTVFDICFPLPPAYHIIFRFKMGKFSHLSLRKETLSVENPATNYRFYLEMKPLQKLRQAIEAMTDPCFNAGKSETMFCVAKDGFEFEVQNTRGAFARLNLYESNLVSFRCYMPLAARLDPLGSIYENLPTHLDGYQDTVCIFHVQGTNQLSFKIRTTPLTVFSVKFNPGHRLFPEIIVDLRTTVAAEDMRLMINYKLPMKYPSIVRVIKKENSVTFVIGNEMEWTYTCPNELDGMTMVQPEQIRYESFYWSYTALLRKASFLDSEVDLCFLSVPTGCIMFQFSIGGIGYLSILKKQYLMVPDANQPILRRENRLMK